jgi:hypothetical protein
MSKQFFLGSVIVSGIVSILLTLFTAAAARRGKPVADGPLLFLSFLTMVYLVVVCAIMWYKAWSSIQDGSARTGPGKAVGFMFIPIFNFYWVFQAVWGFSKDYNSYIERHQYGVEKLPEGLFLASAIMTVVGVIAGMIPFFGVLYSIVCLVVFATIVAKVCDAVNAISTPPAAEKVEEQSRS